MRIVQVIVVLVIVAFVLRESRIFWGIEELKIFDLAYWGVNITAEIYTLQNLGMIWGGLILLVLLSRLDSSKVLSNTEHAPEKKSGLSTRDNRRERKKAPATHPFEMVNKEWKLVFKNPKQEKEK